MSMEVRLMPQNTMFLPLVVSCSILRSTFRFLAWSRKVALGTVLETNGVVTSSTQPPGAVKAVEEGVPEATPE